MKMELPKPLELKLTMPVAKSMEVPKLPLRIMFLVALMSIYPDKSQFPEILTLPPVIGSVPVSLLRLTAKHEDLVVTTEPLPERKSLHS